MPGPENLVELDCLGHALARREGLEVVVGRVATQAEVVHPAAHLLGVGQRPVEIRRVELDRLVADPRDLAEGARNVLGQRAAHRVEFEADGIFFDRLGGRGRGFGGRDGATGDGGNEQRGGDQPGEREEPATRQVGGSRGVLGHGPTQAIRADEASRGGSGRRN